MRGTVDQAKPVGIRLGANLSESRAAEGEFIELNGERMYRISDYDAMEPFFMTLLSHSDHWLFISSAGALSAGRKSPDQALFPYYTVDKIHDNASNTGSATSIQLEVDGERVLWEPFSDRYQGVYQVNRNLYKSDIGHKLVFEEENIDLALTFRYEWKMSDQHGFVRASTLINNGSSAVRLRILDGIQNLMPYGVDQNLQRSYSNLADAYKKNERVKGTSIGLFMLSSIIVDRAEPSEALKTNWAWSFGLPNPKVHLTSAALGAFRRGQEPKEAYDIRGERGAYLLLDTLEIKANSEQNWCIVADLNKDIGQVKQLKHALESTSIEQNVQDDLNLGAVELRKMLAKSDALQLTSDELSNKRHLSNVQFNIMRGGLAESGYLIDTEDLIDCWNHANKPLVAKHQAFIQSLPAEIEHTELVDRVRQTKDFQLLRLAFEYLPFSFSRRHGDPSRPWNYFNIDLKTSSGSRKLYYEGNWRDLFQNWEALAVSYPQFVPGMIAKFVNASTADGYNPYRITRNGIDWEVIEPDNPWSNIGYWGDHQLIYLLKLLEIGIKHKSDEIELMLRIPMFSYANVPYRIKGYQSIEENPSDTILFDHALQASIEASEAQLGSDGKLILDQSGNILQVTLAEKLLLTLLTKLSNFVPEAGIWLTTQRPEWNDANNALVGNGASMVTVYQMRRYIVFIQRMFSNQASEDFKVTAELEALFKGVCGTMKDYRHGLNGSFGDQNRKGFVVRMGETGERYRNLVYSGFSEQYVNIQGAAIQDFLALALQFTDHSINANQRADDLFHSYNLIQHTAEAITIRPLYEMLEGQVNVIDSGILSANETVAVLDALKASALFREDQYSYILYPNRDLPRFEEKNTLGAQVAAESALLQTMSAQGDKRLAYEDLDGIWHFNGDFRNSADLQTMLEAVQADYPELVTKDRDRLLDAFEETFDHASFTGRSGTFFGYEGLGSIYWHMVSKLLLAVGDAYHRAIEAETDDEILGRLVGHYYEIRAGIGLNKSPMVYGAFPTDAYSHTPEASGAKQPGMTGQVKEDILSRFNELGVRVSQGNIEFKPALLRKSEFLQSTRPFHYFNVDGKSCEIEVTAGSLAFTYCQAPVVYHLGNDPSHHVTFSDGSVKAVKGHTMDAPTSQEIFGRSGKVAQIDVYLEPSLE